MRATDCRYPSSSIALARPKCHVDAPRAAGGNNDKSERFYMRNFHLAGRSTVHAQNAMVATSHPLAALAAIEVLKAGGTAADAAVAACALLGVIEPQSTKISDECIALGLPRGEGIIVSYNSYIK